MQYFVGYLSALFEMPIAVWIVSQWLQSSYFDRLKAYFIWNKISALLKTNLDSNLRCLVHKIAKIIGKIWIYLDDSFFLYTKRSLWNFSLVLVLSNIVFYFHLDAIHFMFATLSQSMKARAFISPWWKKEKKIWTIDSRTFTPNRTSVFYYYFWRS